MKFIFKLHTQRSFEKSILFLDRDGVVIEDTGYPSEIKELKIKANTIKKLIKFKKSKNISTCGFVTNQSGVARGYFTEEQFWKTHNFITKCCIDLGLEIDFTCVNFFDKSNYFRKPNIGMLETVINYCKADRVQSFMIGDKETDKSAAEKSFINYRDVTFFI